MIKTMMRRVGAIGAVIALGLIGAAACSSKNDASDIICQPSQKFRCNDCPNAGERGWQQCSSDGKSYATGCTECTADPSAGNTPPDNSNNYPDTSTPKKKVQDAGGPPDTVPQPTSDSKDGGGGQTSNQDLPDAQVSSTGGKPVESTDLGNLQSNQGARVGACSDVGLGNGLGVCSQNGAARDFVIGCVSPDALALDCQRYETPTVERSICTDNGTNVGCRVFTVYKVDDYEKGHPDEAMDMNHACPSAWDGYGNCTDKYLHMCVGGRDMVNDCVQYGSDFTCGTNASGKITCQHATDAG